MTKARELGDNAQNTKPKVIDAKGDLIVGTGSDAADNLAAGASGETLVADSSTATGLRYQGSYPAGKNVLINGLLDIWQRSTSVTFGSHAYNAQDRWANFAGVSSTFEQETTTVPAGCRFSCKITVGATANAVQSQQVIETFNAAPYAGQTMTFSTHFQSTATPNINLIVSFSTSVDVGVAGSWTDITATSGGSGAAGASSFTRISGVYAIPSNAKSLRVVWFTGSLAPSTVLFWGGNQFEAGSVATTLVRNGATLAGELAACQRYYFRFTGGTNGVLIPYAFAATTTFANGQLQFPVPMRIAPTSLDIATLQFVNFAGSTFAMSSVSFNETTATATQVFGTVSGVTAGHAGKVAGSGASSFVGLSAEL